MENQSINCIKKFDGQFQQSERSYSPLNNERLNGNSNNKPPKNLGKTQKENTKQS